jgi:2-C-methyl-D-erythritol 4-phosphate cytidylyltransferase
MQKTALIVGGGIGTRIKTKIPKQFLLANNLPILMHTINKFSHLDKIILVIPKNHFEYWNSLCIKYNFLVKHKLVEGGDSRFQSVKNGLKHIDNNDVVLIHDGVRPMISKSLINKSIKLIMPNVGVIPITPVINTIRQITRDKSRHLKRSSLFNVQTPQCFNCSDISKAYNQPYLKEFTDDASVFEANGGQIKTIEGEDDNIKITKSRDLKIADMFLKIQ